MARTIVHPALEAHLIHEASCRHRKQGLVCSTCAELAERAARIVATLQVAEAA